MINIAGGRAKIVIDGVDFTAALSGSFILNFSNPDLTGVIYTTAQLTLKQTLACPESLDPDLNPRWQVGKTAQVYIRRMQSQAYTLLASLRILSRPVYNEYGDDSGNDKKTLPLDLGCNLTFRNGKQVSDELTEIDPNVGKTRAEVIQLLLAGSYVDVPLADLNPSSMLYYPTAKLGSSSFISTAGQVAFSGQPSPWYLYCNPAGNIACRNYEIETNTPRFYATAINIDRTARLAGDEYTKPVEKIKCTGTKITVFDKSLDDQKDEEYASLGSLIGGPQLDNKYDVLVGGRYTTTTIEGNTVKIHTDVKTSQVAIVSDVQTNTVKPVFSLPRITEVYDTTKTYDTKEFDDDTNVGEDDSTGYILTSVQIKQKMRAGEITRVGNTIKLTEELYEYERIRETWEYDDDFYLVKYTQAIDNKLGDLYPQIVPPIGTPTGLVPAIYQAGNSEAWVPNTEVIKTWTRDDSGDTDVWTLKTENKIASGLNGGQSRYDLVSKGSNTDNNASAPGEPERLPKTYALKEEAIDATAYFSDPSVTNYYDTYRTEAIAFPDDEETLERLAKFIHKRDYTYAHGRNFRLALTNDVIDALTTCAMSSFLYTHTDGSINKYACQGMAIKVDAQSTVLEFDAPLLGKIQGAIATVTGNVITVPGWIYTTNQPVIFSSAVGGLLPGVIYYAQPNGSGGFRVSATPGGAPIALLNSTGGYAGFPTVLNPPYVERVIFSAGTGTGGQFKAPIIVPRDEFLFGVGTGGALGSGVSFLGGGIGTGGQLIERSINQITGFSPTIGTTGTEITIEGAGFTGATAVRFGGTFASAFTVVSDTEIRAVVGEGTQAGLITIACKGGTVTSSQAFLISGGGDLKFFDQGVNQGTATEFDVQGSGASLSVSGDRATLVIQDVAVDLFDNPTVNTDLSLGKVFKLTATANRFIANPTNLIAGQSYTWQIRSFGSSRTMTWGTAFDFGDLGTPGAIAANKMLQLRCISDESHLYCHYINGYTARSTGLLPETAALLARFTGSYSSTRKQDINTFINALKVAGVWNKLDCLYLMAANNLADACRNWKTNLYNCTVNGSLSFVADRGVQSSASSQYLDTGFNPVTAITPNYQRNSASMAVYSRTNLTTVSGADMGSGVHGAASYNYLFLRYTNGQFFAAINGGGDYFPTTTTDSFGLHAAIRSASTTTTGYRNGSSLGSQSTSSVALASNNIWICRSNDDDDFGGQLHSDRQLAAAFIGGGLTATEVSDFYTALQAYLTSFGANV